MSIEFGQWKTLPALPIARSHPAVVSYKNKIYVFGGGGPNFLSLDSSYVFDPAVAQWQDLPAMPSKRSGTAAFVVDDKIYVLGGGFKKPDGNFQFLTTVEVFDPNNETWETSVSLLQPHDYPAAAFMDGYIYILGGHHPKACLGGPKTDPGFDFCERWRPGETSWQTLAALPTPRFAAAAFVHEARIMVSGGVAFTPEGFNNFDFFETYSSQNNQWIKDPRFKLPWPAAGHGLWNTGEHVLFFGGYSTDNIHARAIAFSYATGEWLAIPDMPLPRAAMGYTQIEQTLYLVGGWADDGRTPLDSVVAYEW
ncbi:MAG: hypothetical protein OEZ58_06845 [Gammaproteobacteria bacterium]|nr:hypothetical protein [Gammaproteobacteria bacterium]MDH5728690.1 hypothetical protein [Gammaproteobacteria bacterium]